MATQDDLDSLLNQGSQLAISHSYKEAAQSFNAALILDENNCPALYGKAFCERHLGNFLAAQECWNEPCVKNAQVSRREFILRQVR
jgi:tetratricopeptide (TPR) repeat protein